jgi:hypothetical protein
MENHLMVKLFLRCEKFPMEKQQNKYTYGNIRVSQVKYRSEEHEKITSPDGNPLRQKTFVKREVEHVYHFPVQERGISSPVRE